MNKKEYLIKVLEQLQISSMEALEHEKFKDTHPLEIIGLALQEYAKRTVEAHAKKAVERRLESGTDLKSKIRPKRKKKMFHFIVKGK